MSIRASANLFPLLGVAPALGRTFTADEDAAKGEGRSIKPRLMATPVRRIPGILGQTVEIDGASSQVIGVMPESFYPVEKIESGSHIRFFPPGRPKRHSAVRGRGR